MIIDSHEHIMLPTEMQLKMMDEAGIDKTILFCTAPHPEQAASITEIETEMAALNKVLVGANSKEANIIRQKGNISDLISVIRAYPECFLGFGSVPLGMTLAETREWIQDCIISNSLLGVGEFTPGNEQQILQLDIVFQAIEATTICPMWVHTFSPVTMDGIKLLMELCEQHPQVPVIFGHLGGTNWIEVIKFAKTHRNVYLDLSAAFASIATKMALAELPKRCLFSSDAPYGEPYLYRELVEFVSPSKEIAKMALGDNLQELLHI